MKALTRKEMSDYSKAFGFAEMMEAGEKSKINHDLGQVTTKTERLKRMAYLLENKKIYFV